MVSAQIEQRRGILTQRIIEKSNELLGYSINQKELRLMAYVQYQLINSQKLKREHINSEEQAILKKWRSKGYILTGVTKEKGRPMNSEKISVTKSFYNAMNAILWLGYVDLS